jgi:hypothetical protein
LNDFIWVTCAVVRGILGRCAKMCVAG